MQPDVDKEMDLLSNLGRIFSHDLPIPGDWIPHHPFEQEGTSYSYSFSLSYGFGWPSDDDEEDTAFAKKDLSKIGVVPKYSPKLDAVKVLENLSFVKARQGQKPQNLRGSLDNKQ